MGSNVKHAFVSAIADGGDTGLVRPSNWNAAHEGAVEILDQDLTEIDVDNTVSETSVYSFSIPAGAMGSDGGVELILSGDMLMNSGGGETLILKVKLGTTTIMTSRTAFSPQQATSRYKWGIDLLIMNSAVAVQKAEATLLGVPDSAEWAIYSSDSAFPFHGVGYGTATEDTASARTLDVTAKWSAAVSTLSFRKEMALLKLIPAS